MDTDTDNALTFNPHYSAARRAGRLDDGIRALTRALTILGGQPGIAATERAAEWTHSALLGLDCGFPPVSPGPLGEWAHKAAQALAAPVADLRLAVAGDADIAAELANLLLGELTRIAGRIDVSRVVDQPQDTELTPAMQDDDTAPKASPTDADSPDDAAEPQDVSNLPVIDGQGQTFIAAPGLDGEITALIKNAVVQAESCKRALRIACRGEDPGKRGPKLLNLALGDNEALRRILEAAGKISAASAAELRKSETAKTRVVGVQRGGDVARTLAPELAGLRHPALRMVTLAKIAQREALEYRLGGEERVERGPMVILLDESGSMSQDLGSATRFEWAKAVTIAALDLCVKQRRELYYATFDDGVGRVHRFAANGQTAQVARDCNRLQWAPQDRPTAVMELMTLSLAGGGTNFDQPLRVGVAIAREAKATARPDLVFVTDGEAPVSPRIAEYVRKAKADLDLKVRLVQIGAPISKGNALAALCDTATAMIADDGGLAFAKVITL